ncbi:MAG: SCO family protein [Burkholderiaceae bacterium]|nr:SCO family protein [Burkholderiaceae bacterium]
MKKLLAALGVSAALALSLAACDKGPDKLQFQNTDLTGLSYAEKLSLTDHTGKPVTLDTYKGKVLAIFFGFTQCPEVCPTTLANMANVMQQLGPQADQVQVLFVTLDPERDTQELLQQYVPGFDQRFVGLRGTPEQVAAAAKEFKVIYNKVPGKTADSYTIEHTAATFVFDKNGKIRLYVRDKQDPATIVHDLKLLLS